MFYRVDVGGIYVFYGVDVGRYIGYDCTVGWYTGRVFYRVDLG